LGYHKDHVVPLALGGEHAPNNIQLLCPACNLSKGARHPVDFMQSKGMLL
jgi:5-methylcytosine-specific restriction endonuclease McrA